MHICDPKVTRTVHPLGTGHYTYRTPSRDGALHYRLKDISIKSKNNKFGVLTKELCKFQAMNKISSIAAPAAVEATLFHHFRTKYELKLHEAIYG